MSWDETDDRDDHSAWCLRSDCDDKRDYDPTDDETVRFVKKSVRIISRTVLQAYRPLNHYEREYDDMAFTINKHATEPGNDSRSGERKSKGVKLLNVDDDLSEEKRRCKITWAGDPKEANGPKWAAVTVRLEAVNSKRERLWNLSTSNPNLDVLITGFGNDAHQWVDREVWLWRDDNNPSRTPYIRSETIPTDGQVQQSAATSSGGM